MKNYGISLILLIITIVVIIILASTVILSLTNNGILDQSKKAKFMSDFKTIEEGITIYSSGKYNLATGKFELPLKGYLTQEDKTYIKENLPTLNIKIDELSGAIDTANLGWISSEDINVKLPTDKHEKGYILDVNTGQIYDYNGDVFEGKRWHTLDNGVDLDNISNGYIKLTLLYPAGSTERQWRLGNPGELRLDASLQWQAYVSPINIPIYRMQDVWIKYLVNGNYVTVPPVGELLVDIIPDETVAKVEQVTVTINYDEDALTKEYRIGNSGWVTYTEPFVVTENIIVAARSTKREETKDSNGNVILVRDILGSDKIFIGNIGIVESELVAPYIERIEPINAAEKARVKITYPESADQKIYKQNYGLENNYVDEISINVWDTTIIAYYYDINGNRSKGSIIVINDPGVEPIKLPEPYKPIDKNNLNDLNNPYNPNHPDNPDNPNNPFSPNNPNNPNSPLNPNGIYNPDSPNYTSYPDSTYDPTNPDNLPLNGNEELVVKITADPEPLVNTEIVNITVVSIEYDTEATTKTYKINNGQIQNYTGSFEITENSTIYAYAEGSDNRSGSATKIIDNLAAGISEPLITPNPSETTMSAKVVVSIQYDENATIKKYSINGSELIDYIGEFEIYENNTVIYAYNENTAGESAESTYTVTNVNLDQDTQVEESPDERTAVLEKDKYYIMKLTYPENSRVKDYKFTEGGIWTSYKADGIMLIKSQYKDEVLANIQSNGVLQIEDDNGNTINFTGDWYVINTTVATLMESLFMRWDLSELSGPQIVANTTNPAKEVMITLLVPEEYKLRQYKVVKTGGEIPSSWENYTIPFKVDTNNSTIYAKYVNQYDEESGETTYKVTNIDNVAPVINLVADFTTSQKQISVQVNVTDNMKVDTVKWDTELRGDSYFESSGTEILNNATVVINENGIYTFYATDTLGNKQTYTLTVTNIDDILPTITASNGGVTTSSITINATASDVGGSALNTSSYQYSKNNGITWTASTSETSYTFTGLTTGIYQCMVKVADNAGNSVISNMIEIAIHYNQTFTATTTASISISGWYIVEAVGGKGGSTYGYSQTLVSGQFGSYIKARVYINATDTINIVMGQIGGTGKLGDANMPSYRHAGGGGGGGSSALLLNGVQKVSAKGGNGCYGFKNTYNNNIGMDKIGLGGAGRVTGNPGGNNLGLPYNNQGGTGGGTNAVAAGVTIITGPQYSGVNAYIRIKHESLGN